jgi:prepilin-type N-terminal cleavage/methylation domain-containing protein
MHLNEKGFTLIELMVTIGLLSLMLVLTLPVLNGAADSLKLKAEADRMAAVMRMARQEAIVSGQVRTVVFFTDGRYQVFDHVNNKYINYRLDANVKMAGNSFKTRYADRPACFFQPLGNPLLGGTVALQGSSGKAIYRSGSGTYQGFVSASG